MAKILHQITDLIAHTISEKYRKLSDQINDLEFRIKSLELDKLVLEREKLKAEYELSNLERQAIKHLVEPK